MSSKKVKIVLISDTHCRLSEMRNIPAGDILVHSGDACLSGNRRELELFVKEYDALPHKHKIFVAGNHDRYLETHPIYARKIFNGTGINYLEDSGVEIEGIKFWGSPWQPEFCDWAFNLPRGSSLKRKWDLIPEGTDVLVTHGPPMGCLDAVRKHRSYSLIGNRPSVSHWENVGCKDLADRVRAVKPRLHVFGHIHTQPGVRQFYDTFCVNAAIGYHLENRPVVVDWTEEGPLKEYWDGKASF